MLILVRRFLDPAVSPPMRASLNLSLLVAALTAVALATGGAPIPGLIAGASAGIAVGGVSLHIARAHRETRQEVRNLWSLTGAMTEGRLWPAPGGWALGAGAIAYLLRELPARNLTNIVELGPGTSSIILGRCFPEVRMFGLEHDVNFVNSVSRSLQLEGLTNYELIHAPLTETDNGDTKWYSRKAVEILPESIDVVIVDGPPNSQGGKRAPAWDHLRDRLHPGALILIDDTDRPDDRRMVSEWLEDSSLELVADHQSFMVLRTTEAETKVDESS